MTDDEMLAEIVRAESNAVLWRDHAAKWRMLDEHKNARGAVEAAERAEAKVAALRAELAWRARSALGDELARVALAAAAVEAARADEREAMQAQLDTMAANALRGREASDAALARAVEREREACAALCDEYAAAWREGTEGLGADSGHHGGALASAGRELAVRIRARGEKGGE